MRRGRSAFELLNDSPYGSTKSGQSYVAVLVLIGVLYAAYFDFRYNGLWIENDTSVFTATTKAMLQAGNVFFSGQYSHGPGYPAWLGVLSLETGLSPAIVNSLVAPFFGVVFMIMTAYLLYRGFLRTERATAFSVMMLLLVPDLLFTVLRGNHEKFNVSFIMLAFYSLVWFTQAKKKRDLQSMAISTFVYYICVFMNGVTNDYFGVFLAFAGLTSLIFLILIRRLKWTNVSVDLYIQRFRVTAFMSALLMLWVMVFVFPQSNSDASLTKTLSVKLKNLFLTQQVADNPYKLASQQWVSPFINQIFSGFHLTLMAFSAVSLLYLLLQGLIRKRVLLHAEELVLAVVYLSMAFLVALAIPVDFVGLNAGTNLELRNYTYYALFAPPVIVTGASLFLGRVTKRSVKMAILQPVLGVLYGVVFLTSMLKSTVDPIASNIWMQYSASERQALQVFGTHTHDAALWVGADNRLVYLYHTLFPNPTSGDVIAGYSPNRSPFVTAIMLSPLIEGAMVANKMTMPNVDGMDRMFDDGGAQIYREPVVTPFQY